jgi:hypothetical protein
MNSVTSSYLAKDRRVLLLSWSQERHLIKHSLQPGWCDQQQQFKIATRLPCERVWHAAGRQDKASRLAVDLGITHPDPHPALQDVPRFVLPLVLVQRRIGSCHVLFHQSPRPISIGVYRLIDMKVAHHLKPVTRSGT